MGKKESKRVKAQEGDTLCTIAMRDGGFLNCDPLRDEADNSGKLVASIEKGTWITVPKLREKDEGKGTGKKHPFRRKNVPLPSIRFVHGSKNLPYKADPTLRHLNVSNYPSDKGGEYPTGSGGPNNYAALPSFPDGFGYNDDGHKDKDTFKIEVVDPKAGGNTVKIQLEALKPVYKDGKVASHTSFAAADPLASSRKLEVEAERVKPGAKVFRSRYLRLVTNKHDFDALSAKKQGITVASMADGLGTGNDQIEALDQILRAEYDLSSCKATKGAKCKLVVDISVGRSSRKRKVKTAVHILRTSRGGAGVVTRTKARESLLNFVREIYAQAELSVKLVKPSIRLIEPPRNMIAISNERGLRAEGGKKIEIRVRVDGSANLVSITTTKGHTPHQTAKRLAKEIRKVCKVRTKISKNPPIVGRAIGSADIIVGKPLTQNVRLSVVTADDRQDVDIGRIISSQITEFGGADSHVGTLDERVLIKNYDSGRKRIDTFIVGTLHQSSFGEAFSPNLKKKKSRRPIGPVVNSVVIKAATQLSKTHAHTTIPHEWAHVLQDASHIPNPTTELITNGAPVGTDERVVNGPKRIGDPPNSKAYRVSWDDGSKGNPLKRLRKRNKVLLTRW